MHVCVFVCTHVSASSLPVSFGVGFETEGLPSAVWPGGETEALTRLERHLERKVDKNNIRTDLLLTSSLDWIFI